MEKKIYSIPNRSILNLKNLPPIDPNIITKDPFLSVPNRKKKKKKLAEDDPKALVTSNSAYTTTQPHDLRAKDASFGSSGCKISTKKTHKNIASPTDSTLEGTDRKPSFEVFRSYRSLFHCGYVEEKRG
ncbi:hypothetical protein FEM48_Zijuj11G0139700 [Ziziphus jujuba var. spinosa]|uniref:Uncharacterized protein n=1 Tax=Ziziphus jujuba var. spinosa TaxID=714518 RepID=A0A978UJC3_ZIZJJ|nr:hypothetical protein FEM48_Zijuj11G0139700 [Ziziphus jujuba var. spinosa]